MNYRPTRLAATVAGVLALAGCTSAGHLATSAGGTATGPAPLTAARWWSDAAGPAGSTISTQDPTAAAAKLTPDTPTYCAALKATLGSGKSVFNGAAVADPAIVSSTRAWIAELSALAPADLHQPWQTFGNGVLQLLTSAAKTSGAAVPSMAGDQMTAINTAESAIEAQAKSACGLDLFTGPTGSAVPTGAVASGSAAPSS